MITSQQKLLTVSTDYEEAPQIADLSRNAPVKSIDNPFESDSPAEIAAEIEDEEEAAAGLPSTIINIMNTLMGAGMLSLPEAISKSGLIPGLLSIFLMGTISSLGLILLAKCAARVGRSSSFSALAKLTYPKMSIVFDLAIAVKCFGVALSYLVIIGDLMPEALRSLSSGTIPDDSLYMSRNFWISVFLVIIVPFSFMRRMDSLKYTSSIALLAVFYLAFLVTFNYFDGSREPAPPGSVKLWDPKLSYFSALPVYVFAFTCHQNLFAVYNELKRNTPTRVNTAILSSIGTAVTIYCLVGSFGYLSYGDTVKSNVLRSFGESRLVTIARIAITLLVAFSFPIQAYPCRASIDKFWNSLMELIQSKAAPNTFGVYDPVDNFQEQSDKSTENVLSDHISPSQIVQEPIRTTPAYQMSNARFIIITSLIVASAYTIALNVTKLGVIIGLVGATGSTTICYILPGLFYLKMTSGQRWDIFRVISAAILVFGIIAMPLCVIFVLLNGHK